MYALRSMWRSPGFTAVAVLALALGIGANTAVFTVVNAVLIRPLPYREPDRLFTISQTNPKGGLGGVSYPDLLYLRVQNHVFEGVSAHRFSFFNLTGGGDPEEVRGEGVSSNLFHVLGVEAALGRTFLDSDAERVVVLSDALWRRRFHADREVIGRSITLNDAPYTVIGVTPASFDFPPFQPVFRAELWTTALPLEPAQLGNRGSRLLELVARLKPGISLQTAQAETDTIAARLANEYPATNGARRAVLRQLRDAQIVEQVRPALWMLLGASGFVLLIGCANVAALQLARAAQRRREIAIRASLGATRWQLVRQMLVESLLLALPAGALAVALANWSVRLLAGLIPANIPNRESVSVDMRVLGFTLAISVLTGILFGLTPAARCSRTDLADALKNGGPSGSPRHSLARGLLLVFQVALSVVLLVGAGLLTKSFLRLIEVNPGFRAESMLTLRIQLPKQRYSDAQGMGRFYSEVLTKIRALPGVQSAGTTSSLPLQIRAVRESIGPEIQDHPVAPGVQRPTASYSTVSGDYFRAIGIPLREGRYFNDEDRATTAPAVVIGESMARRFWPGENAVGKRMRWGGAKNPWFTVVGVVGDVRLTRLGDQAAPEFYALYSQLPESFQTFARYVTLVIRTSTNPLAMAEAARREVWSVDASQTIPEVKSMEQVVDESVAPQKFYMILLTGFSILALCLGAAGLYGLLSYSVSQRTHEIGVRMALGARRGDVLTLVMGQGLRLTLAGVAAGIAGALGLGRVLTGFLYGTGPQDPATYVGVALLLTGVSIAASYLPARRATKVDPLVALREE